MVRGATHNQLTVGCSTHVLLVVCMVCMQLAPPLGVVSERVNMDGWLCAWLAEQE